MTVTAAGPRRNPGRAGTLAAGAAVLQAVFALGAVLLARASGSDALAVAAVQCAAAALVWLLVWFHLRLRRRAEEEAYDLEEAERRRRAQGLQALFEADAEGAAAVRDLRHFERILAPVGSWAVALLLSLPLLWALARLVFGGTGLAEQWAASAGFRPEAVLAAAVLAIGMALCGFLLGTVGAGLSREPGWQPLRAGAGQTLAAAVLLFVSAIALALGRRDWFGDGPDRIVALVAFALLALQAVEMLANWAMDFYRPRLAGVESRPAYDSRLTGLLAEPRGIFRTFAHTLDYQFGFRVSETWFFRFLEKAFAPLALVWLATFHLLTCLVPVRPGEAAIISRWGLPRGVSALPADDAGWDLLPAPLGPGLHLKWPWPVETARILPRERIQVMHAGFPAKDEAEYEKKVQEMAQKVVLWNIEHVEKEQRYLMPLVREEEGGAPAVPETGDAATPDVLFLSGTFTLGYRIGSRPGDPYRHAFRYLDAQAALRVLFERELSVYLAGANFWDLMGQRAVEVRRGLEDRLREALAGSGLGLELASFSVLNIHPPAGETGKQFQEVLAARQEREAKILEGKIEALRVRGLAPAAAHRLTADAAGYRYGRVKVAEAEKERFVHQAKASAAAPEAYRMRVRYQALEDALSACRLTLHPPGIEVRIDNSRTLTPTDLEIEKNLFKQAEKENR